jgi:argininosuccinate synthase
MYLIPFLEFYDRFAGRQALLDYASQNKIPVQQTAAKPWSTDENLFHISYEAGILEYPDTTPPSDMWKLTKSLEEAPNTPEKISIEFKAGLPVKVTLLAEQNRTITDPVDIFLTLNALGRKHGIGRIDIVENRFIGVKSRGCYESPGATILRAAHIDIEGLTLDRNVRALRDQFVTVEFSRILYNGHFFTPEREFVTSAIPASQRTVNGLVRLKLYKGNVIVEGRNSAEVGSHGKELTILLMSWSSRDFMMSMSHLWMSLEASSPRIRLGSSKSNPLELKSSLPLPLDPFDHSLTDTPTAYLDGHRPTSARVKLASNQRTSTALVFRLVSIEKHLCPV